ncbi:MAG: alkaline phosphatase D family protein [Acidimicrobiia bacterium]
MSAHTERIAFEELIGSPRHAAFPQGVKSAPPTLHDAQQNVVLWTRVLPINDERSVAVRMRIWPDNSTPSGPGSQLRDGIAQSDHDYTVRVAVDGLTPGTRYRYQFERIPDGAVSELGATHTLHATTDHCVIGLSSCQARAGGHWTAYREIARQALDLFLHVGDYIYAEDPLVFPVRQRHWHPDPTGHARDLDAYREKWREYGRDPHLQRAHATTPFAYTWDDHEFENNWNGGVTPPEKLTQFDAAQQAMFEYMPLLRDPEAPGRTYHTLRFGELVEVFVTDGRQYRIPGETMLGEAQCDWLLNGLRTSTATWKLVVSSTAFTRLDKDHADSWTGFAPEREAILTFLHTHRIDNVIIGSGDTHVAYATDLELGFERDGVPASAQDAIPVGVEVCGGAISSPASSRSLARPHLNFIEEHHNSWATFAFTPNEAHIDLHFVETDRPNGRYLGAQSFRVAAGARSLEMLSSPHLAMARPVEPLGIVR